MAADTDWERVELDYRAGVLSLREIATSAGVTEGAIRKRAKRDAWTRDLSAKIQARAEDLVRKAEVRAEVRSTQSASERDVIEANAERIAQVRGEHRSDITRGRKLVMTLFGEIEAQTTALDDLLSLGEMLRKEDDKGVDRLNDLYRKVIETPGRVDCVKKLVESMKSLVALEREAYGLTVEVAAPAPPDPRNVDPVEAARRIAFALQRGASMSSPKSTQQVH